MNTHTLETVWAPRVLSILRIVAAILFFEHGTAKLLGFP
ncbi:MAG TPA: DoxX family protein, partial [Methyloceanibacter sp.]|nr:DoxX family protein [Methyloceanibacter sp.]